MSKYINLLFLTTCVFLTADCLAQIEIQEVRYSGAVGTSPIVMTFEIPSKFYNSIHGTYYYTKFRRNIEFREDEDSAFDGPVVLYEYYGGKKTGYFRFSPMDGFEFPKNLTGMWFSVDGKRSFQVKLTRTN